ncbi:MAG: RNA-protein complex protein Nop10 [Halobacteria archaeon]
MKSLINICSEGCRYTMEDECPVCGSETLDTIPPRFSPEDPYGKYRRKTRWTK